MMILMLLYWKWGRILISISYLTVVHDDIDASILEAGKDSNLYFIVNCGP